jgi:hypothetical protein
VRGLAEGVGDHPAPAVVDPPRPPPLHLNSPGPPHPHRAHDELT